MSARALRCGGRRMAFDGEARGHRHLEALLRDSASVALREPGAGESQHEMVLLRLAGAGIQEERPRGPPRVDKRGHTGRNEHDGISLNTRPRRGTTDGAISEVLAGTDHVSTGSRRSLTPPPSYQCLFPFCCRRTSWSAEGGRLRALEQARALAPGGSQRASRCHSARSTPPPRLPR